MTNLDCIFKSRDITLPTKVRLVKALVFPVVMYGCERWTIKKAECLRMDTFELWCWKRLLRVPWTARKSNQSIVKEINAEYSLERLMLKLQYFSTWCEELTHWKRPWCWERLKAGREGVYRGWDGWMASLTQWAWVWASSGRWWRTGEPGVLRSMGCSCCSVTKFCLTLQLWAESRHDWVTEQQQKEKQKYSSFWAFSFCFIKTWNAEDNGLVHLFERN